MIAKYMSIQWLIADIYYTGSWRQPRSCVKLDPRSILPSLPRKSSPMSCQSMVWNSRTSLLSQHVMPKTKNLSWKMSLGGWYLSDLSAVKHEWPALSWDVFSLEMSAVKHEWPALSWDVFSLEMSAVKHEWPALSWDVFSVEMEISTQLIMWPPAFTDREFIEAKPSAQPSFCKELEEWHQHHCQVQIFSFTKMHLKSRYCEIWLCQWV